MKKLLIALAFVFVGHSIFAQDLMFKTGGEILKVKIKNVGPTTVVFKRYDNQDGPDYTILKKDLIKIHYEGGMTDSFDHKKDPLPPQKKKKIKYGDNILSVIPGAFSKSLDGLMNDLSVGVCYERLLGKNKKLGFILPVSVSFSTGKDYTSNLYLNTSQYIDPSIYKTYNTYFVMPGLKYYTASDSWPVRYAIGGGMFAGFGTEPYDVYNTTMASYNTGEPIKDQRFFMYGLMFNNSINIMATKYIYLGLDFNLCMPLVENRRMNSSIADMILGPFAQIGVKLGCRF